MYKDGWKQAMLRVYLSQVLPKMVRGAVKRTSPYHNVTSIPCHSNSQWFLRAISDGVFTCRHFGGHRRQYGRSADLYISYPS